jgi:hypothetical protein
MLTLTDLLNSAYGLRFLESRGVYTSLPAFKARLEPPSKPDLVLTLGAGGSKLVCSGQQIYVDYRRSVVSKILALRDLRQDQALSTFFLWLDTDRCDSDALMTKLAWPEGGKRGPIPISPPGSKGVEARFVQLNGTQLRSVIDKLGTHLRQSGVSRPGAKERYLALRAIFLADDPGTLSTFNLRLTRFLLQNTLGWVSRPMLASTILDRGAFTGEIDLVLNQRCDVIRVFNDAVHTLVKRGIDPQVKPLREDYLPLFYSCRADDQRLRLIHSKVGSDHYAIADCRCGEHYRFHLGGNTLSMAEIAQTKRWSPDVCLPLFLNDLVSGFVMGKSSVLYGLVLNAVLETVLQKPPVPMLVPPSLAAGTTAPDQVDSLIYQYIHG